MNEELFWPILGLFWLTAGLFWQNERLFWKNIGLFRVSIDFGIKSTCIFSINVKHTCDSFHWNTALSKSTKSRNSNSSVQMQTKSKSQLEFVPRDTEESEFLDLGGFGDVASSVETVIWKLSYTCVILICIHSWDYNKHIEIVFVVISSQKYICMNSSKIYRYTLI